MLAEIAINASQSAASTAERQAEMIETIAVIANASNTIAARGTSSSFDGSSTIATAASATAVGLKRSCWEYKLANPSLKSGL